MKKNITKFEQFTKYEYNGTALLKEHKLDDYGTWRIYAADTNDSLHGSHYTPCIETMTGKLRDIIRYAVQLGKFWSYGSGEIKGINIKSVDSYMPDVEAKESIERDELVVALQKENADKMAELQKEQARIQQEIRNLQGL